MSASPPGPPPQGPQPPQGPENPPTGPPHDPGIPPTAATAPGRTEQLPPHSPGPAGPWPAPPDGPSRPGDDRTHGPGGARTSPLGPLGGLAAGAALLAVAVATGVALVASTLFDRPGDDFNQPAFLVVLVITAGLLALTAAAGLALDRGGPAGGLSGTVAALAAVHLGLLVVLALGDSAVTGYVAGLVIAAAAAAAYVWLRSGPPVAAVVLGALVVLTTVLDDTLLSDDPDSLLVPGVTLVVFGAAVAGAGWVLPTRNVSAMLGGMTALLGAEIIIWFSFVASLGAGLTDAPDVPDPTGDVVVAMVLGLAVCAGLLGLYARTGFTGYAVLAVLGATLVTWTGMFGLQLDSTLVWSAVLGGLALVAAAAGVVLQGGGSMQRQLERVRGRRSGSTPR